MTRWIIILALVYSCIQGCRESESERKREQAIEASSVRVSVIDGAAIVTLDETARQKAAIVTDTLQAAHHQRMIRAFGVVLPIRELIDLYNAYAAAEARSQSAQAALSASRQEYLRLKGLYADDRNSSEKAAQLAEAAWRSDEARARATQEAYLAIERNARQQWGETLASAVLKGSPLFTLLTTLQEALIQVSVPAGEILESLPDAVRIQTGESRSVEANLVTRLPRTDPRFQGVTLLYRAPRKSFDFLVGMNLPVLLPSGEPLAGVNIPASAVVWWQGKAWLYVEISPGQFTRRELPVDLPLEDGWFVIHGFSVGEAVVLRGAQLLLSQELRGQIQMSEGG
jgi:hypothetical protein